MRHLSTSQHKNDNFNELLSWLFFFLHQLIVLHLQQWAAIAGYLLPVPHLACCCVAVCPSPPQTRLGLLLPVVSLSTVLLLGLAGRRVQWGCWAVQSQPVGMVFMGSCQLFQLLWWAHEVEFRNLFKLIWRENTKYLLKYCSWLQSVALKNNCSKTNVWMEIIQCWEPGSGPGGWPSWECKGTARSKGQRAFLSLPW